MINPNIISYRVGWNKTTTYWNEGVIVFPDGRDLLVDLSDRQMSFQKSKRWRLDEGAMEVEEGDIFSFWVAHGEHGAKGWRWEYGDENRRVTKEARFYICEIDFSESEKDYGNPSNKWGNFWIRGHFKVLAFSEKYPQCGRLVGWWRDSGMTKQEAIHFGEQIKIAGKVLPDSIEFDT